MFASQFWVVLNWRFVVFQFVTFSNEKNVVEPALSSLGDDGPFSGLAARVFTLSIVSSIVCGEQYPPMFVFVALFS